MPAQPALAGCSHQPKCIRTMTEHGTGVDQVTSRTSPTKRVVHLAVVGGPSAGKSTVLRQAPARLAECGWRALVVPEPPTLLITGGLGDLAALARADHTAYHVIQREILGLYLHLRETYHRIAEALPEPRVVVLHDRGALDLVVYNEADEIADLGRHFGHDVVSLAGLYDAVLYLASAATIERGYVTTDHRHETKEEAAALDAATIEAWLHHPHLAVVAAQEDFETKMALVFDRLASFLAEPSIEYERKFLLHAPPPPVRISSALPLEITQDYLCPRSLAHRDLDPELTEPPPEIRLRCVETRGSAFYVATLKSEAPAGRYEREVSLTAHDYDTMLLTSRDPRYTTVKKTRYVFVENGQRFELDHLYEPKEAWILEAELASFASPLSVPAWLGDLTEVTDDPAWRNSAIALRT